MDCAKDSVRLDKKPDCILSECLFTDMVNGISINFDCPIVHVCTCRARKDDLQAAVLGCRAPLLAHSCY